MFHPRRPARPQSDVQLAKVLCTIGDVLRDCHLHSTELQDAISTTLSSGKADPRRLRTFQGLDHVTQVQEDLSRLLPALAEISGDAAGNAASLSGHLRLVSLRDRLFAAGRPSTRMTSRPGDVDFFDLS